jgi:hypothetical protein
VIRLQEDLKNEVWNRLGHPITEVPCEVQTIFFFFFFYGDDDDDFICSFSSI